MLNPNAQPFFYSKPNPPQPLYFPRPICHYVPLTYAFYPPPPVYPFQNVKTDHKVWPKRNRRYRHPRFHEEETKLPLPQQNNNNGVPFPNTVQEAETSSITTVMIRNIPNQFKFEDLILILDDHCFRQNNGVVNPMDWSKFDFVYLPMDYRKQAVEKRMSNLGYAFVNFTTPAAAFNFYRDFHGFDWDVTKNNKICQINVAQYQGRDTLKRIFQAKVFRCPSRDFLPVLYSQGRDGLNRRIKGTNVGNHVWGLPRRAIGTRAFFLKTFS